MFTDYYTAKLKLWFTYVYERVPGQSSCCFGTYFLYFRSDGPVTEVIGIKRALRIKFMHLFNRFLMYEPLNDKLHNVYVCIFAWVVILIEQVEATALNYHVHSSFISKRALYSLNLLFAYPAHY